MRTGLVISALLHAGAAAVLLFGPIEIVDRPDPPVDLPLEMVFEAPAPVPPDFGDDFAELDAASVEGAVPRPAPESTEALDEPVPDGVPEWRVPDVEPIAPIEAEPEILAEVPAETAVTEVEIVEPAVAEAEIAEETAALPETAPEPPPAEDPAGTGPETVTAEPVILEGTQTAEAPPPAPLPKRKPAEVFAEAEPEPEPLEPAQAKPQDVAKADTEPVPSPETEPEPAYRTPTITGALTPGQLLDNLAALRDEETQAKNDPELWTVIRAVRDQVARCWLINPAEARNANLSVDIAVAFDKTGKLLKAEVQEVGRMVTDEAFKDFAMAAHSALKSCSPFDLPLAQYDLWQRFTMRFVPRTPS